MTPLRMDANGQRIEMIKLEGRQYGRDDRVESEQINVGRIVIPKDHAASIVGH